jgi:hypothetical protein
VRGLGETVERQVVRINNEPLSTEKRYALKGEL